MKKILIIITLLSCFIWPVLVKAQTWKPLGPDETANPSLTFSTYSRIAIAPDGTAFVAYSDDTHDEKITVRKFDGAKWVTVGQPGFTPTQASDIFFIFSPDGTPYITYVGDPQFQLGIEVYKLSEGAWVKVGLQVGSGVAPNLSFAPDGTPYIAWNGGGSSITVEKLTTSWQVISDTSFKSNTNSSRVVIGTDGTPYVAYIDSRDTGRVSVEKLVGTKWQIVGKAGFTDSNTGAVNMVMATDGTLYVSSQNGTNKEKVTVSIYKNGSWSNSSTAGLSLGVATNINMAIGPNLEPFLIFSDAGNSNRTTVLKYTGSTWNNTALVTSPNANYDAIAVSSNNIPYITYTDSLLAEKVVVKTLVNNIWGDVNSGGISNLSPIVLLKTDPAGNPIVAFNDVLYNNAVSIKEFSAGSWAYIGQPGISTGNAQSVDMNIASDGTPYVVYEDTAPKFSGIIKKFVANSWQTVGSGINALGGSINKARIAIAPNGIPYVAYQQNGANINVQQYVGNQWAYVGAANFSNSNAFDINIAIDKNNTPYVAYEDNFSAGKVNVKKFDGTNWQSAGAADFSAGNSSGVSLALDTAGVPFVAYYDNTAGLVVQKLVNNNWTAIGSLPLTDTISGNIKLIFDTTNQLYLLYTQYNTTTLTTRPVIKKLVQNSWTDAGTTALQPWSGLIGSLAVTPAGNLLYGYLSPQLYVRTKTADSLATAPIISNCSPQAGSAGTIVTITGFNFSRTTSVKFGKNNAASYTLVSPTTIKAIVGNGASGLVTLTTPYGTDTYDDFSYNGAPPIITSFSPNTGGIGTLVTIKGKNFGSSAAANIVYFGAVRAQVILETDTTLQVKVLAGSTYQPITVTANKLTGYASGSFDLTFTPSVSLGASAFTIQKTFRSTQNPSAIAIQDMDNDGLPDIVVPSNGGTTVLHNKSLVNHIDLESSGNAATGYGISAGDLDGDGKPDLAFSGPTFLGLVKNNSNSGSINYNGQQNFLTSLNPVNIFTTDVDGDGRPDVVLSGAPSTNIAFMRNSGALNGNIYLDNEFDLTLDNIPTAFTMADLDGDGKPDLVVLIPGFFVPYSYMVIYKNISTPNNISFIKIAQFNTGASPSQVVVADLDGDGKPDILVPNSGSNTIRAYKNLTDTTIAFDQGTDFNTGSKPNAVAVADLDGDGKPDIAVVNSGDNTVSIFQNTSIIGSLNFSAKMDYATGKNPFSIAAGDLDGDGAPELTVTNERDTTISVLRNNLISPGFGQDNFKIAVTSTTCRGSANGSVQVTASEPFNYVAHISGGNINKSLSFISSAQIDSLEAGSYSLCISPFGYTNFSQCDSLVVTEPQDLSVYSTVDAVDDKVTVSLNGGGPYNITINNKLYTTTDNSITLLLSPGENQLTVYTNKACQGVFSKLISLSDVIPYPNPYDKLLSLNLGNSTKNNVVITVREIGDGKIVYSKAFGNSAGVLQLDLSKLASGIYALQLSSDQYDKIFKIIKKK